MERFLFYYGEGHSSSRLLHLRSMLATLLLFAFALGTKAQAYQTYDANTCYSKILIDAKINDFAGNTKPMGFGSYNSETGEITQLQWYTAMEKIEKNKRDLVMDYVAGVVAKSIIEAADYYKDFTWSKPWFKLVENYATSVSVPTTGASLDDLNASKMYFALAELTKTGAKYENSTNYAKAIAQLKNALTGLKAVNDNYSIRSGSTVNYYKDGKNTFDLVDASGNNLSPATTGMNAIGGWYHKATYPNQMWCDSEYMGPALLAQLVSYATSNPSANIGTITGSTEGDWKIVAKQFDITWNYLWNSSDKLLYHAFSATPTALGAHTYTWATGTNGTNTGYWARAIGWYFLALVDVLENMPDNISDNSYTSTQEKLRSRDANIKTRLTSYLTELAAGIWAQKKGNNLWTNVINEAVDTEHSTYATSDIQSNTKNYLEASASAIYIAAYIKAMRLSLLSDGTYKSGIETAYQNYISNFITTDNNIINTCASAGLGGGNVNITSANSTYKENGGKYRNGTADYYTRGYDVTKITSYQEGKPLGAFILASTEYERYMKSNYAPSFIDAASENPTAQTITAGESVTLHAAAMAKPVAKYQWYSYPAAQSSKAMRASATPAGTAIDGANSSDLTVKPEANTYYYCVATNEAGTAQTEPVLVTVSEESNEGSGSETENATSSTIATFEGLSSGSSNTWTATENNGFDIPSITLKQYANIYSVRMNQNASITLNVPEGYTVTSLKITACDASSSNTTEITVNSVDKITIDINTGEHKEYGVSLTNAVTGANTISITNSGAKELGISKIIVCGYKGTPSSLSVTTQPVGATYDVNAVSVTPLNVVVSATGISSEISYQWYSNTTNSTKNGTPIEGATSASYTPSVANAGTIYYYCVATAGGKSVTSGVAAVAVLNKSDIACTTACGGNSNTWTPAAGGTIALSELVTSSSTGAYTITSGNDFATLSADGTTLTAKKGGTITLTQAADGEYASGSVDINIAIGSNVAKNNTNAYTVETTQIYSDGLTVAREDITMTFGNDGFWTSGKSYTQGKTEPTLGSDNVPTSGTYYKFSPTSNGTLKVDISIGENKNVSVIENIQSITPTSQESRNVTFAVTAGKTYYVYVSGSKASFYGFEFKASNSNATFTYDGSALTFTKEEGAGNTYEATLEVGADKKGQDLSITLSAAAGATVKLGETAVSGNTVTVKAPETVATPATYTVTVTSADGTSTTIYKITVKLKKTAIVLKYVLNDNSEDATEERKANAEWFWDKLANPSKEFTANTLVLHAYIADSKGNATTEELTSLPSGIKYESDMPSVATVDKDNGTITLVGNSLGRAYIYATLENAEYEAKETRCAVYIRDGYTYNVTDADKNTPPTLNAFRYITDKDGKTLVRMKFGGWKWNNGEYVDPKWHNETGNGEWESTNKWVDDKHPGDYKKDSWGTLADSGVTGIDGFTKGFPGKNDACDESMKPSTHYNSTRYGWFKAPSDDKNNLHDPNNITETSPFTLPVRGAYMTFEPMVNGTMSVFIIQNGAWNTWSPNDEKEHTYTAPDGTKYTYKKGDIKKGEFRPHSFQVVNQRGLTLSQFATKWSVDTKQKVTDKYYCNPDDETHSSEGILSPNVADWPEFNDGRLTDGERADIVAAWKGGPRGMQKVVMLHDGSFLAVEKGIVKYTFHVTGHETYYFFSNFSKMGFCGANFTPDADTAQPTATLELDDQVAYPTITSKETAEEYEGNSQMPTFGGKELPKIKKHTFTIANAVGTDLDKINVEGAQAPQFKEIVMNRTFKKGQWNTLCVPFNMTQRKVEEIFGVGTQLILLETAKIQGNVVKLHFLYHEIQNVLPGYPYLIKPTLTYKKGGLYENDSYSDGAAYTSESGVRTVDDTTGDLTQFTVPVKHINPIITQQNIVCGDYSTTGTPGYCTANTPLDVAGTIHNVSVKYEDGDVFLSDGDGKLYVSTGGSYGKGYRAYIKKISPAKVKSISMEYSGVEDGGESTPTEIKFTELAPEAVMTLGFRGVYNLSGQKVSETTEGLPAGIYIVNGQKMVVR